VVLRLAVLRC